MGEWASGRVGEWEEWARGRVGEWGSETFYHGHKNEESAGFLSGVSLYGKETPSFIFLNQNC